MQHIYHLSDMNAILEICVCQKPEHYDKLPHSEEDSKLKGNKYNKIT